MSLISVHCDWTLIGCFALPYPRVGLRCVASRAGLKSTRDLLAEARKKAAAAEDKLIQEENKVGRCG